MRTDRKNFEVNQAVILCGGYGKRLGSITKNLPKPLIKIGNKKFIDYLISFYSKHNVKKILLLCYYKSKLFYKLYNNKIINNISLKCVIERKKLDTGGALKNSFRFLNKFFYICNGDTYFNIKKTELKKKMSSNEESLVVALTKKNKKKRYNYVKIKNKLVFNFNHKNQNNPVYSGIGLMNKKILKYSNKKIFNLEKDLFPILIKNKKIKYEIFDKEFLDIGVPEDLNRAKKFIEKSEMRPSAFLDRDGVINVDHGYVHSINNFNWKTGVKKAIKYLNNNNFYVFVITNQSGIGRGYYNKKDVEQLHLYISKELKKCEAHIDDFVYAPYFKQSKTFSSRYHKSLRKPNSGMIDLLQKKWNIDFKNSFLIGDQESDIKLAKKKKLVFHKIKPNENLFSVVKKITKDLKC